MSRHSVQMLAAAIAAVLLLADAPAHATAISKNFNATASVAAKCVMSNVGDLNFGAYDPVVANATTGLAGNTSFTLTCTRGSSPIISLSVANANFGQNIAGKRAPAYIDSVVPGSPADKAGLQRDDLIVSMAGEFIRHCKDYDDAVSALQLSQASMQQATARVQEAELNLSYTRVTAPVSGITGRAERSEGSLVTTEKQLGHLLHGGRHGANQPGRSAFVSRPARRRTKWRARRLRRCPRGRGQGARRGTSRRLAIRRTGA